MNRLYLISAFFCFSIIGSGYLYGADVLVAAGDVSHRLSGLNRTIEKTESFLNNEGILTTVITLKPEATQSSASVPKIVHRDDQEPANMRKDVVQDQFWKMLKERLSVDTAAQKKLKPKSNVILAKNKSDPQPEPQLPTDVVEPQLPTDLNKPDMILSPEEKEELNSYNQSIMPPQHQSMAPPSSVIPYAPLNQQHDQAMVLAMQMQMSAQALSNQAAALMMQGGQRQYMPSPYQQTPPVYMNASPYPAPTIFQQNSYTHESSPALPRSEKMSRLMNTLNQIMFSGVYSMQRLVVLIDLEIDIIERLLAGETGARLEKMVEERNKTLTQSAPPIVSAYDLIVDLATTDAYGDADSRLYHYFVRSGKKEKVNQSSKKKFLLSMMYAMKHYQEMLESMYNVSRATMTR